MAKKNDTYKKEPVYMGDPFGLVNTQAKLSYKYNPDLQVQRLDATVINYDETNWANLPKDAIAKTFPSRKIGRY